MDEPRLQPAIQRTGGSVSARMAAAAIATLLIGVVWLGVSGRSGQVPPASSPVPSAVGQPETSPEPAPATPRPTPAYAADPIAGFGEIVHDEDAYGVTTWLRGRLYMRVLRELEEGHLWTSMRLPFGELAEGAELNIMQLWTDADRPAPALISNHPLQPHWLVDSSEPYTALFATVWPAPPSEEAPRLVRQGYLLKVEVQPMGSYSNLIVDIVTPPSARPDWPRSLPDSAEQPPHLEAHLEGHPAGDRRLMSIVGLGGRPPGVMTAHVLLHDRFGREPSLTLYHYPSHPADGDAIAVVELGLDVQRLRRGHPEQLVGEFKLLSSDGNETGWQYRITPIGTGSGVLLLIEAERTSAAGAPVNSWTCWSSEWAC